VQLSSGSVSHCRLRARAEQLVWEDGQVEVMVLLAAAVLLLLLSYW
jgi:hypothetical protein